MHTILIGLLIQIMPEFSNSTHLRLIEFNRNDILGIWSRIIAIAGHESKN